MKELQPHRPAIWPEADIVRGLFLEVRGNLVLTPSMEAPEVLVMTEEGVLIGISQLGATFAGLISVFLVFARKDGRFSPADGLRIRGLIYVSLLIVAGALLPLLVHGYGATEAQTWRISAAFSLAVGAPGMIDAGWRHLSMAQQDRREVGLIHSILAWGLSIVTVLILGSLALGYGPAGNYLLALVLSIAVVMANFLTLSLKNLL